MTTHSSSSSSSYPASDDLYIYMSGVPFSVKSVDVRAFFQPVHVLEAHVIHDLHSLKPTGECCCQLSSKSDRDRALEKHDQLFRNRVVKIKPLTYVEYQQYVSLQAKVKEQMNKRKKSDSSAILPTPLLPLPLPLPMSTSLMGSQPNANHNHHSNRYQNNSNNYNNNSNSNNKSSHNSNGQSQSQSQAKPALIDLPPLPTELQKYRSSLVLLSNVSFDASREDILDLLKEFAPVEQTLKIRHDEMGQPTGDAIVACASADDAFRACVELNGARFIGLEIKTALVSS